MENQANPPSPQSNLPVLNQSGSEQLTSSNPQNLPAINVEADERALANWIDEKPKFWTSLPQATDQDKECVLGLMAESAAKTKACVGQTLAIVGFAVDFGVVGESEDGEIVESLRGHILLDDGRSIFTTSKNVLKALKNLVTIYKSGPWDPPVLVEFREVKGKRGDAIIAIPRGRKVAAVKKK